MGEWALGRSRGRSNDRRAHKREYETRVIVPSPGECDKNSSESTAYRCPREAAKADKESG